MSSLINSPDLFSVVVAILAGIVGVVSLVEAPTGALIGVFISVTTIPAAADIGVSSAFANWPEARGSTIQLLLNVAILIAVGAVGLVVQTVCCRTAWSGHRRRGRVLSGERHAQPSRAPAHPSRLEPATDHRRDQQDPRRTAHRRQWTGKPI